jgi:uncharacterized protein (TIGR03437 family)
MTNIFKVSLLLLVITITGFAQMAAALQTTIPSGEMVVRLNKESFRHYVSNNRRTQQPALIGATNVRWLRDEDQLGSNAKSKGFDRIIVADFSGAYFGLTSNDRERRAALKALRQSLSSIADVVEPNTRFHLAQQYPNDPLLSNQWYLNSVGITTLWNSTATAVGGPSTVATSPVKVVLMDSGIEGTHPDLAANIDAADSKNFFVGSDGITSPLEDPSTNGVFTPYPYGHGTLVAGVIGAVGNNALGIAGINWQAALVSYRIFGSIATDMQGDTTLTTSYDAILKAFTALLDWPADEKLVINCSFGEPSGTFGDDPSFQLLQAAISALGDRGLVIAAAGNNGNTTPSYPCALPLDNVVCVTATNSAGIGSNQLSSFSNYGAWVNLAAPGENILTTANNNGYTTASGTSLAAPMVSGAASLLWQAKPSLTASELKTILLAGADYNPMLYGLLSPPLQLNVGKSMALLQSPATAGESSVKLDVVVPFLTDQPGLSYNGIATIYGAGFTDGSEYAADTSSSLPYQLGGVKVLINSYPVPLYYVGPSQINFLVPMDMFVCPPGNNILSVVRYDSQGYSLSGASTMFTPAQYNPGFVLSPNGTLYTETNGSSTVVYGAGLGFTSPAPLDGHAGTGTENIQAPLQVIADGQVVAFRATLSSMTPGLYEILIPTATASSLTIKIGSDWQKTFNLQQ